MEDKSGKARACSLCVNTIVARLDDDDAFTRDLRKVGVGEYNVPATGLSKSLSLGLWVDECFLYLLLLSE